MNNWLTLRNVLAKLYPDEASARRVVADVGLDARYIEFSNHAINNWQAILQEATNTKKQDALIEIVLVDYNENEELQSACDDYQRSHENSRSHSILKQNHQSEKRDPFQSVLSPHQDELSSHVDRITRFFVSHSEQQAAGRYRRNRTIMLEKVRSFWIEGVLESSLHGAVLLQLGMEHRPEMVEHPWDTVLQRPHETDQLLPPNVPLIEIFELFGGSFLILGDPGSGKTTALLELCRDLLEVARRTETFPIPVVFNLSSWGSRQSTFEEWLLWELSEKYQVPMPVAKDWMNNDELLLLLDGLDEVREEKREECVAALNYFRTDHLVYTIVCSRTNDYSLLTNKLVLPGAINQKPLDDSQIDDYLASLGHQLQAVRLEIRRDATLKELARSPLVLSIIALAYRDMPIDELQIGTIEDRRHHLFSTYVRRMFVHRIPVGTYSTQQIIDGLVWLSKLMQTKTQTVFSIESFQPTDLSRAQARTSYAWSLLVLFWLLVGTTFGFACGLTIRFILHTNVGSIITGISYGLSAALALWIAMTGDYRFRLRVLLGLLFGWSIALTIWLLTHITALGLILGIVIATAIIFGYQRIGGDDSTKTVASSVDAISTPRKRLGWSWKPGKVGFAKRFPLGLIFGLVSGIPAWLAFGWQFGIATGVALCLTAAVVGAISYGMVDLIIEPISKPNEGIWRSLENGNRFGFISGLWLGSIVGCLSGMLTTPVAGLLVGISFFVAGFTVAWIVAGGYPVLQHVMLRIHLSLSEGIPFRYADFLNQSVYHIFLRKVGSSFIFVHRLLLEHFAAR